MLHSVKLHRRRKNRKKKQKIPLHGLLFSFLHKEPRAQESREVEGNENAIVTFDESRLGSTSQMGTLQNLQSYKNVPQG